MKNIPLSLVCILTLVNCSAEISDAPETVSAEWRLVSNFDEGNALKDWTNIDVQNETDPFVSKAQITEIRTEAGTDNHYMMRKPAADGVVGNRKALGFAPLPDIIDVGEIYTLYTRFNVEYFPNNHSFGLSNLAAADIAAANYNAFEPMIRITDKAESDGSKNDGTLMVSTGHKTYDKIINPDTGLAAKPLEPGLWYEVWAVINNAAAKAGGQSFDVYLRGGEFTSQQLVYRGAGFRKQREASLTSFIAISNTGPKKQPYGNGGVGYDDIYIVKNRVLSTPIR